MTFRTIVSYRLNEESVVFISFFSFHSDVVVFFGLKTNFSRDRIVFSKRGI